MSQSTDPGEAEVWSVLCVFRESSVCVKCLCGESSVHEYVEGVRGGKSLSAPSLWGLEDLLVTLFHFETPTFSPTTSWREIWWYYHHSVYLMAGVTGYSADSHFLIFLTVYIVVKICSSTIFLVVFILVMKEKIKVIISHLKLCVCAWSGCECDVFIRRIQRNRPRCWSH